MTVIERRFRVVDRDGTARDCVDVHEARALVAELPGARLECKTVVHHGWETWPPPKSTRLPIFTDGED